MKIALFKSQLSRKTQTVFEYLSTLAILMILCTGATACTVPHETEHISSETPETPEIDRKVSSPLTNSYPLPTATTASSSELLLLDQCPTLLEPDESPLWPTGSILFEEDMRLWSVTDNFEPALVYRPEDTTHSPTYYIENESTNILIRSGTTSYSILDLLHQTTTYIVVGTNNVPLKFDGTLVQWLPEGRAKVMLDIERENNLGETRTFLVIDPINQQAESFVKELNLPDYVFSDGTSAYYGMASMSPTGNLMLYTSKSGETFDVTLLDLDTEMVIWQQLGTLGWPATQFPEPYWDSDGQRVLFRMTITSTTGNIESKFFSLTHDGELESLPLQPFPFIVEANPVLSLSRSPNGRYLFYHLGPPYLPNDYGLPSIGIVIDLVENSAAQICDAHSNTLFLQGDWISEDLFLYLVRIRDREGIASLRILDLTSWKVQEIAEINARPLYNNAFGWTSLDFPE